MSEHRLDRWIFVALISLVALTTVGCDSDEPEVVFEPTEWQGEIDESLSAKTQARQDALIRLFDAIQRVGLAKYDWDCPDIDFRESQEEFFGDEIDFFRWSWAGPPQGNQFPVLLVLRKDDAELTQVEHRRVYAVTRRGSKFVVRRVSDTD